MPHSYFLVRTRVPGDVQELCDALWSVTENGESVSQVNLEAAYRYIFAHEGSSYEIFLKQLTLQQRKVLRALAVGGGAHTLSNEFRDQAGVHNESPLALQSITADARRAKSLPLGNLGMAVKA